MTSREGRSRQEGDALVDIERRRRESKFCSRKPSPPPGMASSPFDRKMKANHELVAKLRAQLRKGKSKAS
ncbi:MAG: hypothetical protein MZU97_04640 [Bacillus subtilis]|nr:hypothetical protein [Bacillus subtilis]